MFASYTEIHWQEILYLEERLVDDLGQASRAAHTDTTWAAMLTMVDDGVLDAHGLDSQQPSFDLTDLGWELAGLLRRWVADSRGLSDFVYLDDRDMARVRYFGCVDRAGHYLWEPGFTHARDERKLPWGRIDGALTPAGDRRQGADALHHLGGWTAWAMWDYSVDKRGGSNAVFFAPGVRSKAAMQMIAQRCFPSVMRRLELAAGEVPDPLAELRTKLARAEAQRDYLLGDLSWSEATAVDPNAPRFEDDAEGDAGDGG